MLNQITSTKLEGGKELAARKLVQSCLSDELISTASNLFLIIMDLA